eukprot:TRINITY_DN282_c0_g1_i2.p1 TRINITY_DN282_c0_g1~~TRINITY_DN282_c0_g1_i2.p1  ORF type:complete len:504 (-),score=63.02 TRINITY_DN282_c0_g1_i2:419-1930(-)
MNITKVVCVLCLCLLTNKGWAGQCNYKAQNNSASTSGDIAVSGNSIGADKAEDTSFSIKACSENNTASVEPGTGVSGNEVEVSRIEGSIFTIDNNATDNRGNGSERSSILSGNRVQADRVYVGDPECTNPYCYFMYIFYNYGYEYCYCYYGYDIGDASQGNIQQSSKNNTGTVWQGEVLAGNDVDIVNVEGSQINLSSESNENSAVVRDSGNATSGNTNEFGNVQEEVYYGYSFYACDYYYCYYYGYCSGCEPDVIAAAVEARNNATNNTASTEEGGATSGNKNTIGQITNADVTLDNTAIGNEANVDYAGEAVSGNKNEISTETYGYSSSSNVIVDNVAEDNQASGDSKQTISGNDNKFNMVGGSQVSSTGVARGNRAQGGSGDSISGNRNTIGRAYVQRLDDTAQGNTATSDSQGNAISGNYVSGSARVIGDSVSLLSSGNHAEAEDGAAVSGNRLRIAGFGRKLMASVNHAEAEDGAALSGNRLRIAGFGRKLMASATDY